MQSDSYQMRYPARIVETQRVETKAHQFVRWVLQSHLQKKKNEDAKYKEQQKKKSKKKKKKEKRK